MSSFFHALTEFPEDPIMSLPIHFALDPRKEKVNLGIGTYRDSENQPFVLPSVRKAEANLYSKERNKEYLPIEGDASFIEATSKLVFGKDLFNKISKRTFSLQTIGGTSALRTGGEFLAREVAHTIFIPKPSWPNHRGVFTSSGLKVQEYRYYDSASHRLMFNEMCSDISQMPARSAIVLHANCHNPTGVDLSNDQWDELSLLIKQQGIIPFFDSSYQGFKESVDDDVYPIRTFTMQGHEMLVASSYSKNFGLYCERVGSLHIICQDLELAKKAASQVKSIVRTCYSNPSKHGGAIVAEILNTEVLNKEWLTELGSMRDRLKEMRRNLIAGLQAKSPKDWSFLTNQHGFFSFSGLSGPQVQRLIKEYGIYMQSNGRINVAGINSRNIDYVVSAILSVSNT